MSHRNPALDAAEEAAGTGTDALQPSGRSGCSYPSDEYLDPSGRRGVRDGHAEYGKYSRGPK